MENTEYNINLTEKWQIIAFEDFVNNIQDAEITDEKFFENWLNEIEFDRESSYLEISVKIKAR